jgi:hypothetical protein
MFKIANRCILIAVMICSVIFSQTYPVCAQGGSYAQNADKQGNNADYSDQDIIVSAELFGTGIETVDGQVCVTSDADNRHLTASVEIGQSAFYTISVKYYPFEGSGLNLRRALLIDGKKPFDEASFILYRRWRDEARPVVNSIGDEVKPRAEQLQG